MKGKNGNIWRNSREKKKKMQGKLRKNSEKIHKTWEKSQKFFTTSPCIQSAFRNPHYCWAHLPKLTFGRKEIDATPSKY